MNKDFAEGIEFCALISGGYWLLVITIMLMVYYKTSSNYYAFGALSMGYFGCWCMSWIAKKMYLERD